MEPAAGDAPLSEAEARQREREEEVRSEAREYLAGRQERRRLFPRAALVGLLSGLVALAFRWSLVAGEALRVSLTVRAHRWPAVGWAAPMLLGATFAAASVWAVRRLAPEAGGSGIPHLEAVLRRLRPLPWERVLPVKFLGGVAAIGLGGLALGREGPTVQMGAAVGAGVADTFDASLRERETLLVAGAGAGLSAAFNAPLAGLVFVLEEVEREFTPLVFGAALVATVIADVVARVLTGQEPVFRVPTYATPPLAALPAFLALGLVAGTLGIAFNRGILGTLNRFAAVQERVPPVAAAALAGALVGLVGWFAPGVLGGGHGLAERALAGHVAVAAVPLWFALRFALTMASYGSGAPGGIFAPLLVLGALAGLAVGRGAHTLFPAAAPEPAVFAVVGMAAYFTAIVRAPLTGIVLIVEMTGSYALMLPLLVTCFCAYALAEALGDRPIYEALLERDLLRGGETIVHPAEAQILDLTVSPGALFDGKAVRDLGLPPGCVLVTMRRRGAGETVVSADTRLQGGDRLVAVVAPEQAAGGARRLREGCEAPTAARGGRAKAG